MVGKELIKEIVNQFKELAGDGLTEDSIIDCIYNRVNEM